MKKGLHIFLAAVLVLGNFFCFPMSAQAAEKGIVIDGAFEDWADIEQQSLEGSSTWFESGALTYDDTYAYLYVSETASSQWEMRYRNVALFFKTGDSVKVIRLIPTDYSGLNVTQSLVVANSWCQALYGAQGKVTRSQGKNQWEIAVPLQVLSAHEGQEPASEPAACEVKNLSVYWCDGGEVELAGVPLAGEETPREELKPGLPEGTGGNEGGLPQEGEGSSVAVDGYYDDWENAPVTKITYGSWNHGGDWIWEYHDGRMLVDDEKLYIQISMCDTYHKQIPIDDLHIVINGEDRQFAIRYEQKDGTIDWDSSIYNLADGIHTNLGMFVTGDARISLGDVAMTITPTGQSDSFEMALDLDSLLAYYHIDKSAVANGAKIEFYSPNIGPERLVIVGTSTWPYVGVILCIGAALAVFAVRRKKRA